MPKFGIRYVYIGCAAALYGDLRNADLMKVHIGSGKVSLMRYDDFEGRALPRMVERVKIKLREQDVDYFAYGEGTEYPPPYLFRKSRFVNEEFPGYPEQVAFEEALDALGLFDLSGYGPDPDTFDRALARHRWQVEGLRLTRPSTPPALDDLCGRFLTFRQLIECGETQARTGLPNLPHEPTSWNALQDLAAAGPGPGDRLVRQDPFDLRLLLPGVGPGDPRAHRSEARPACRV